MRVDIGGGTRLFFDVAGSGLLPTDEEMVDKPTLLMLHGGPGFDHSSFRPYFDRFADTHQVVYLDHRGQGRSDERDLETGWDLDTWADDVVRFCDALEITKPIVLGNSFGGFVAMRYAARHPEHASKVILSSTQARRFPEVTADRFEELGGARVLRADLRASGVQRGGVGRVFAGLPAVVQHAPVAVRSAARLDELSRARRIHP